MCGKGPLAALIAAATLLSEHNNFPQLLALAYCHGQGTMGLLNVGRHSWETKPPWK